MNPNRCEGTVQHWHRRNIYERVKKSFLLVVPFILMVKSSTVSSFTFIPMLLHRSNSPHTFNVRKSKSHTYCFAAADNNTNFEEVSSEIIYDTQTTTSLSSMITGNTDEQQAINTDKDLLKDLPSTTAETTTTTMKRFKLTTQGIKDMFLELQNDVPLEQESISAEQLDIGFRKLLFTWKYYNATYNANDGLLSSINKRYTDKTSQDARIRSLFALAQEHLIRAYLRSQEEDGIIRARILMRGSDFAGIVPTRVSLELLWRAHAYASNKIPSQNAMPMEQHARSASILMMFWKKIYQESKDVRVHDEGLKPPADYFITTIELLRNENAPGKMYVLYKAMDELSELEQDDAFRPTPDVFEWLLEYLSTRRDRKSYVHLMDMLHHSMRLYKKTTNKGYFPHQEFLNAALFRAGRHGRTTDAMWLFRTLEHCWGVSGPSKHSVRFLFTSLSRSQDDGAALFAETFLKHLETQNDNPELRPSTDIYNLVFQSWSNQKPYKRRQNNRQPVAGARAEALLSRMEGLYDRGLKRCKPNSESYCNVLTAYLNQFPVSMRSVSNADRIYRKMLTRHETVRLDGVQSSSNRNTLDKIIMAYSKLYRNVDAALSADNLFREVVERFRNDTSLVIDKPDCFAYGHVLKCWNRARAPDSATKSLEIFQMIEDLFASGKTDVVADSYCLRQLLDTLAYSEKGVYGELAKELLERTISLQGDSPDPKVLGHAFWCAIRCFSNQKDPTNANIIFDQMLSLSTEDEQSIHITGAPFKTLINSYAMHGFEGAGEKAEVVLSKLEEHYYSGLYPEARPSVDMYNDIILVWTKDPCEGSGRRAQEIFTRMQEMHDEGISNMKPNGFSYMALAVAHALCPDEGCEERAEKIALKMTEWYLAGDKDMKVNIFTWNNIIDAWSKHADADIALKKTLSLVGMLTKPKDSKGRPLVGALTPWTYESLLRALSRSSRPETLTEMESIVNQMISKFTTSSTSQDREENGGGGGGGGDTKRIHSSAIQPSINHVNFLLEAYAKRVSDNPEITQRARSLYQTVQNQLRAGNHSMKPNIPTYSAMIDILTQSHGPRDDIHDDISFADSILKQVEGLIASGISKIEVLTTEDYGKVMDGYERLNDFSKANQVKERMEYMHNNNNNDNKTL